MAGLAVVKQRLKLGFHDLCGRRIGGHQMHKAGADASYFVVDGLQAGKQLLGAEVAKGVDPAGFALESRQMQGHGGECLVVVGVGWWPGPGLGGRGEFYQCSVALYALRRSPVVTLVFGWVDNKDYEYYLQRRRRD